MKIKSSASVIIRIILWLTMLIGGAIYSIQRDLNNPLFNSFAFHIISSLLGLFILKLSFNAAAKGGKELAKNGRVGNIPRLETNRLVRSGIYSCLRHPMLYGLTLLPLGFALLLGSPTFIFIIAPLEAFFIIFMIITFEEAEIKRKFGKEYEEYKKTTPLFTLKRKCLKELFFK